MPHAAGEKTNEQAQQGPKQEIFTSHCEKFKANAAGIPDSCWSCCISPPPMPTDSISHYPPDISRILLPFFILALLLCILLTFFTIYFCRFMFIRRRNSSATATDVAPPPPQVLGDAAAGLDPSRVASFPTLAYSWVKNLHAGKHGLECAVCLSEFQDDDVLRLLTACSHVFHTSCIDVWLVSHTTCPYCRHELNPDEKKSPEVRILVAQADAQEVFDGMRGGEEDVPQQQEQRRSVSFKEDGEEGRSEGSAEEGMRSRDLKRRVRSNSTGHLSVGREDRFTLRLTKDVKERIARKRNWTGSCIDFRDLFPDADDAKEEDGEIGLSGLSDRGRSRM